MADNITRQYFSGNNVVVNNLVDAPLILNGTELTDDLIRQLSGAPDNSEIIVQMGGEDGYSGVFITVKNELYAYDSHRIIYQDEDAGELRMIIRNNGYMLKEENHNKGIGLRSLAIQAFAASNLGIAALTAEAAGHGKSVLFNGYLSWPRMGFDARLSEADIETLPDSLKDCDSILVILQTDEGLTWWKHPDRDRELVFNLEKQSRSWQVLESYMVEKGCQL